MPVNSNIAIGVSGTVAWNGAAATHENIRKHTRFAWTFKVTADITADTTFKVQAAPASAANPCLPGTFADVAELPTCVGAAVIGPAGLTIPAGTPAGTEIAATIPCKPGVFIRLAPVGGDVANVEAVLLREGPKMA